MPVLEDQKREHFCQLIFAGKSDIQAYAEAYAAAPDTAHANAWRVRANEGVEQRITELFEKSAQKRVLTLAKKREILHDIATTAPGAIDENNPLCQSYKRRIRRGKDGEETEEIEYELPSKLKAIELDAKLAGEMEGAGGVSIMVNIALLGQPAVGDEPPVVDLE